MRQKQKKSTRWTAIALALLLALGAAFALSGCAGDDSESGADEQEEETELDGSQQEASVSQVITIAALNGPTGMGMAPLIGETDKYDITVYQAPDEVLAKVIKGEVDIAAVPSNVASVLYNKTEGAVQAAAIQTGGILYIVENPAEDAPAKNELSQLSGCTIYGSGQGGVPEYVLRQLLSDAGIDPDNDVTIQWLASHSDVASSLLTNLGSVALLPEPFVTTVKAKNDAVVTSFDLNALWKAAYNDDLPMGVLVAQKSFLEERKGDWDIFAADMEEAVQLVNDDPAQAAQMIVEAGIGNEAAVVEQAIPQCNICFITGAEMKAALSNLYEILNRLQPAAIGGALPDESFYLQ